MAFNSGKETRRRVIGNRFVALRERHVIFLALAEVAKSAVSRPFVDVSVARAATREEKDDWFASQAQDR